MDPDGVWVTARGNDEFRCSGDRWRHGPRAGAWRDLPVPGARSITFEELHGHRVLDPDAAPTLERQHWGLPEEIRHMRLGDAQQFAELSWARTQHRQRHPELGTLYMFPAEAWERRRDRRIGMWAPELVRGDFRGALAAAGLDESAAARDSASAAGYRRALMQRGATVFGLSHRRLAAAVGISRGRVDQILDENGSYGLTAAAGAASAADVLKALEVAAGNHTDACETLAAAREARAAAVAEARRRGLSFGQIALCLGVSRGRVQQLSRKNCGT